MNTSSHAVLVGLCESDLAGQMDVETTPQNIQPPSPGAFSPLFSKVGRGDGFICDLCMGSSLPVHHELLR